MNYLILYKKASGELFYRVRHSKPTTAKGSRTSMGWLVVDVQCMRNGKIYTPYKFEQLIEFEINIRTILRKLLNKDVLTRIVIFVLLYIIFVKLK